MLDLKDKRIANLGLGYVGLPLAVAFSEKYKVTGFDIKSSRVMKELSAFPHPCLPAGRLISLKGPTARSWMQGLE